MVEQHPLPNLIAEELRKRIWSGEWEWDQRIAEQSVAAEFAVSRTALREALKTLQADGLVVMRPRRGTFVRSFTASDLYALGEARIILEGFAFRMALQQAAQTPRRGLSAIIREMEAAAAQGHWEDLLDADLRFHGTIVHACGNPLVNHFYASIQGQIRMVFARFRFEYPHPSLLSSEHQTLLSSLERADEATVVQTLTTHIQDGTQRLVGRLRESHSEEIER